MNIISIDLPWNEDTKGRRTLAIADPDGNIEIALAADDNGLLELVRDTARPGSIVLLDIPIDGCDKLNGAHFRAIDTAVSHQALPALPASSAGSRGRSLRESLEKTRKGLGVYEIYPYAIYKFLAYLKNRESLRYLATGEFDSLLNDSFRRFWPPKYKRETEKHKRVKNMQYLYSLLTDPILDLKFSAPLQRPDNSCTSGELNRLCDEYDACLGAIVGIYFAGSSSYACLAGDSNSGSILLLADRWLSERLGREVKVSNLNRGV